jgi:hypothetical protein|tara:strand:+ start:239 stop:349 length:111 start_codon:yes stop_codon:yes gene_type:complete
MAKAKKATKKVVKKTVKKVKVEAPKVVRGEYSQRGK